MRKFITVTFASIAIGSFLIPAKAAIISENLNTHSLTGGGSFDYGQSFMTPTDLSWNNITVNLSSASGYLVSSPYAAGTLFILSAEYLGSQGALSSATTGFIAKTSIIENNLWVFEQSVTLLPNTQYWFYTQGQAIGAVAFSSANPFPGGIAYQDTGSGYQDIGFADMGFQIQGDVVPEPSTTTLLIGAGTFVFALARRRHRQS